MLTADDNRGKTKTACSLLLLLLLEFQPATFEFILRQKYIILTDLPNLAQHQTSYLTSTLSFHSFFPYHSRIFSLDNDEYFRNF